MDRVLCKTVVVRAWFALTDEYLVSVSTEYLVRRYLST